MSENARKCLNWFNIPEFNPAISRYFLEYLRGSEAPKKAKKVIKNTSNLTNFLPKILYKFQIIRSLVAPAACSLI